MKKISAKLFLNSLNLDYSLFSLFFLAAFGSYDSIAWKSRFNSYQMATWAVQFRSCAYLQMMLFDIICVKRFKSFEKVSIIFSWVLNQFPLSSARNDANFSCWSLVSVILFGFFIDVGHIRRWCSSARCNQFHSSK